MSESGTREPRSGTGSADQRVAELEAELARSQERVERLQAMVELQRRTIARMQGSAAWQLANRLRYARDRAAAASPRLARAVATLKPTLKRLVGDRSAAVAVDAARRYPDWIARNALDEVAVAELRARATRAGAPTFALVVTAKGASQEQLQRCVASVRAQRWERWELCVALDAAPGSDAERIVAREGGVDRRVRAERLPAGADAVAAVRLGLERAAGEWVVLVDADIALAPEALLAMAARLATEPDADVLYGDEDALDARGARADPFFKPDWSPDLLLSTDYLGGLVAVRREVFAAAGGMRPGFDGAERYDLVLRATERARRVAHVARVLGHRGVTAPRRGGAVVAETGDGSAVRALQEALSRREVQGRVEALGAGLYGVRRAIRGDPLISIVMPTRDKASVLRACVESLEKRSTWLKWELILVDNGSVERKALAYLDALRKRHRVLRDDRAFNWSALNNRAAREAHGEHLLFLNNDVEVLTSDWLEALLEHSQRPEVGAVGARLLYPDGRIQHAGVVVGIGSTAGHAFKLLPGDEPGYAGLAQVVRDVSAVTGACLMTRRETFERVGGFEERMPIAYNDIDFCLKLRREGLLVVYTPFATLVHHESASRRYEHPADDEVLLKVRWGDELVHDPYYSPHLTRDAEDWSIAT